MRVSVSDDEAAKGVDNESHLAEALDIIEHRYGWTDEQTLSLPYLRFQEALRIASRAELAEAERQVYNASFTAWQVYASRPRQQRAKKPKSFAQWTRDLGLDKMNRRARKEVTQEDVQKASVIAHRNAEKVRATFRRRSP